MSPRGRSKLTFAWPDAPISLVVFCWHRAGAPLTQGVEAARHPSTCALHDVRCFAPAIRVSHGARV